MSYEIYLKEQLPTENPWPSDVGDALLISAFNLEDRVRHLFEHAPTDRKRWVVQSEYDFRPNEIPSDDPVIALGGEDERSDALALCEQCDDYLMSVPVCIDMTGFIVPSFLSLISVLRHAGVRTVDVLYSEPAMYLQGETTQFAVGANLGVRPVRGYEGTSTPANDRDVLVIGVGYQHFLIQRVAQTKEHARVKAEVFGWPSLQAHMYQESVIAAAKAEDHLPSGPDTWFAPAADPFVTAQVVSDAIGELRDGAGITNLYLSPLGPKPMALGFALYYMNELEHEPASLIFPFSSGYSKYASKGLSRVWRYRLEL